MDRSQTVVVFDLDDTLYKEIDYLKSAYYEIAKSLENNTFVRLYHTMLKMYMDGKNVFGALESKYDIRSSDLLRIYRNHKPTLNLQDEAKSVLIFLKNRNYIIGLITDGRSNTQRNKLDALGITDLFDHILISEETGVDKTNPQSFRYFHDRYIGGRFLYIGDNTRKDFYYPNKLGWETICLLDSGGNIHQQDFSLESGYLPMYKISSLPELLKYLS